MPGRFGIEGQRSWMRLAAVACLLLAASAPAQAAWREDWRGAVEQGSLAAEEAARHAAQRTERELRNRRLPPELAPAFAATIRMTRNRAHASGVRKAPDQVARALAPYFSPALLNQVRWRPPMQGPSMSTLLVSWYFREGAVTLNDVILFSDARLAQDAGFWAHELTHVEQYRRYGVDGFAQRYLADWHSLEREANDRAARVRSQLRLSQATATSRPGA